MRVIGTLLSVVLQFRGLVSCCLAANASRNGIVELVFDVCRSESSDTAGKVAVLLWQIWAAIWCGMLNKWHLRRQRTGLGQVQKRNSEGDFIMAQTSWKHTKLTVLEGEAVALSKAIRLAARKGWVNVIFETDSNILTSYISSSQSGASKLHTLGEVY